MRHEIIAGRYRLERLVSRGGMGEIYRALDEATDRIVALKLLQPSTMNTERFVREGTLLATLVHPAIVSYVGHGVDSGRAYLAMEWLEGEELGMRLERGHAGLRDKFLLRVPLNARTLMLAAQWLDRS